MSEKVQTEIEDSENQDQSEEPTQVEIQTPKTSPDGGTESQIADESQGSASQLEEAQQQAQDSYDRLLRVSAEFDNYKKRTAPTACRDLNICWVSSMLGENTQVRR